MTPTLRAGLTVLVALVLGFHFGMTLLYVMPLNPLKPALESFVDGYMEPYFTQKWELFAPDPLIDSKSLLVSCRLEKDGAVVETEPADVTTRWDDLHATFRLTPALWMQRAAIAPLALANGKEDDLPDTVAKSAPEDAAIQAALADVESSRKDQKELGYRLFARFASAECDRLYGAGRTSFVRSTIVGVSPPPFSQRERPLVEGKIFRSDFGGWRPYERVAAM